MCMGSSNDAPPPPAPPPAPNRAPDDIENAVDSTAEERKKKRKGSKQLRRGRMAAQAITGTTGTGSGLTIK